ncbi:nucleotidyl transferase AbiEii/AbiGii toxin family protein [Bacteroides acidifaciens]|uniref:nucleotidyl transferase AbiEii/AbiGii toxin family protein n=1 Tax=Bacteroides acidifaciens TaxID=85831 RepID=UPI0025727684|nr:nucleotidyl transferase AbiEii/AbiGii toxin family protein [Bacteroides acidifaciens]
MNLHRDQEAFSELIIAASNELHIPPGIIEKDYYVTLALRELASRVKGMVFKGGTSLTKCYQILERFSEDIDISYAASEGVPGESRKRQLKKAVVSSIESMGFSVANLEETRSRRSYNCYRASYSSIYSSLLELKPELVIETYIALLPFPTVNRMTDNYIYRFLKMTDQEDLAEEFDLMPFEITTQAIERTLIDKVFALCDYYLSDKVDRHSRHLYDIYKIMEYTKPDASLSGLVQEVRSLREPLPVCPSAKTGVYINDILAEIMDKEIYRNDYETITGKLLFTYVPYETVIGGIGEIISRGYFSNL